MIKVTFHEENDFSPQIRDETEFKGEVSEQINHPSETDYNKLSNLPTLNGEVIKGDIVESDPTVPAWAKAQTKPQYTAVEVGAVDSETALSFEEIDTLFNSIFQGVGE